MQKPIKSPFYFTYTRLSARKNRVRKLVMTLVCAAAVAFTALCGGYLHTYAAQTEEYIKNVSERQMIIYNNTAENWYYNGANEPISEEQLAAIRQVENVESIAPFVRFVSIPQLTAGICQYSTWLGYTEEEIDENLRMSFHFEKRSGISLDVPPERVGYFDESGNFNKYYTVFPYAIENYYDPRCSVIDPTVKDGAYLTGGFADAVGITNEMLDGLTLTFETLVPVSSLQAATFVYTDGNEDGHWERGNANYYEKATVTVPVRGIFRAAERDMAVNAAYTAIFMPGDQMLAVVEEHLDPENIHLKEWIDNSEESTQEYYRSVPQEANVSLERTAETWAPEAYYVVADDISVVEQVKKDLLAISPNFSVHHEFQDFKAGEQYVNNSRSVMFFISYSILAVVFLLMALIYVYLIDRRKFEFAVLRANGLTKREVRKVIYTEMFFQFAAIFLLSLVCAAVIYFVMVKSFGYPFTYDGMTVVYALLISLGAIVLPTIISLAFVNKFEPDAVMRN